MIRSALQKQWKKHYRVFTTSLLLAPGIKRGISGNLQKITGNIVYWEGLFHEIRISYLLRNLPIEKNVYTTSRNSSYQDYTLTSWSIKHQYLIRNQTEIPVRYIVRLKHILQFLQMKSLTQCTINCQAS